MPLIPGDPNLKLLYGMDESSSLGDRANSGSLGSAHDFQFTDYRTTNPLTRLWEGVQSQDDGRGGKAVLHHWLGDGYSATHSNGLRYFWDKAHADFTTYAECYATGALPTFPIASADDNFAIGCRFRWQSPYSDENTAGIGEIQEIFYTAAVGDNDTFGDEDENGQDLPTFSLPEVGFAIVHEDVLIPTKAAFATGFGMNTSGASNVHVEVGTAWAHESVSDPLPGEGTGETKWIAPDVWYRVLTTYHYESPAYYCITYILNESTGALHVLRSNTSSFPNNTPNINRAQAFCCGGVSVHAFNGLIDECWFYDATLDDDEARRVVQAGFTIPWAAPEYTYNDHDVKVSWTNAKSAFPKPRQLPNGVLSPRHIAGAHGTRMRLRYNGSRPSRPWALQKSEIQFDTQGPRSSQKNRSLAYENANLGLVRRSGQLPPGSVVNVNDITFDGLGPRRRAGFRIRRDCESDSITGRDAFYSFRSTDDQLHRFFKAGTSIYFETGAGATELQSGWSPVQQPSMADIDNRLIILTEDDQAIWNGGASVSDLGIAAPTTGAVGVTAGTLIGTYGYAYTFYDPNTGDESAPREIGEVTLATQGANLNTLDNSPDDARFTQQKFYRTTDGGASPAYFFIYKSTSLLTQWTDANNVDGTELIDQVDGSFISGTPPEVFSGVAIHSERAFYFGAATNPARVYWSEANDPFRWAPESFITFNGPVRAVISRAQSLVVFTDRTVELMESDFIRDGNGSYSIRRTVLSNTVGCPGPNAVTEVNGQPYWIDRRGIYTLRGDIVQRLSKAIDNVFRYLNMGLAASFSAAHNHIKDQVWFCVAFATQTDNTRQQTQIVLQLPDNRWTIYGMELTFVEQFDDDLNGIRFGGMDHLGVFKELESYEGDGIDDPADLTSCESEVGSVSSNTVTVAGASPAWTVNELRGMGLILRDLSTGVEYYDTIISNTADSFTLVNQVNALIAADDEYEIGGMNAFLEYSEQNLGSSNMKALRWLYHEFDDLTAGNFV